MSLDDEKKDEMEFEYSKVDERVKMDEDETSEDVQEKATEDAPEAQRASEEAPEEAAEETVEETPAEPDAAQTEIEEENEAAEEQVPEATSLDIYSILRLMVGMTAEQAWINLGIRLAPGEEDTQIKLTEARICIDTLQFIRQQLESNLKPEEKSELDALLSNLQMNYVQRA